MSSAQSVACCLLLVWWQVRQIREVNAYGLVRNEVSGEGKPDRRATKAVVVLQPFTTAGGAGEGQMEGLEMKKPQFSWVLLLYIR
jgi:hypothetical protein